MRRATTVTVETAAGEGTLNLYDLPGLGSACVWCYEILASYGDCGSLYTAGVGRAAVSLDGPPTLGVAGVTPNGIDLPTSLDQVRIPVELPYLPRVYWLDSVGPLQTINMIVVWDDGTPPPAYQR